jgi:hypothetical protein
MIATGSAFPVWSPDARSLAYVYLRTSGDRYVDTRLVVRPLEGGERAIGSTREDRQFLPTQWTKAGPLLGSYIHLLPSLSFIRRRSHCGPRREPIPQSRSACWRSIRPVRYGSLSCRRTSGGSPSSCSGTIGQDTIEMLWRPPTGDAPSAGRASHAIMRGPTNRDGRTTDERCTSSLDVRAPTSTCGGSVSIRNAAWPLVNRSSCRPSTPQAFYISQQLERAEMSVSHAARRADDAVCDRQHLDARQRG